MEQSTLFYTKIAQKYSLEINIGLMGLRIQEGGRHFQTWNRGGYLDQSPNRRVRNLEHILFNVKGQRQTSFDSLVDQSYYRVVARCFASAVGVYATRNRDEQKMPLESSSGEILNIEIIICCTKTQGHIQLKCSYPGLY